MPAPELERRAAPRLGNAAIADAFEELADLYALDGAIVHRVMAYRNAARAVRDAPLSVSAMALEGRATELAGIGTTLQEKILALIRTGAIPSAERLRAKYPPGVIEMTRLPGLGAKRARQLHEELGIDSPAALREAALAQRLRTVRGLGPKFEERVLAALEAGAGEHTRRRLLLPRAVELAAVLIEGLLARGPADTRIEVAGSIRRQADSVKDIDLAATTSQPLALARCLSELEQIESAGPAGEAGAGGRTHSGVAIELRVATPERHGNLLQHLTGSGAHNAALRERAVRRGLRISEHGVIDERRSLTHTCAGEAEVYELAGLVYIEPELREDRGELQAAARGPLPALIEQSDIRGDLHCHTVASDGHASIEEMALAARARGYEYLAITDHSASHGFGHHVSPDELWRQIERVHETDAQIDGIRLLAGSEVNILPDGSLDYDEELLAALDWVIASVHTQFRMSAAAMTGRMVAAIEHPLVDAIGHPTGRLIDRRRPYDVDLEALFAAAARAGTMIEINANPDRRDLSDANAREAARAGVTLLIDSDAHWPRTLANMRWGVATARRAWLTADDVANTRPLEQFMALRKRARGAAAGSAGSA